MGRKKKEQPGMKDRIGEALELEKCPVCSAHTDCFAWIDGHCTALKESGGEGCVFFKPLETAVMENKRIYRKLRGKGRGELILQHEGVFAALGAFDEEISEADRISDELVSYEQKHFENALADAGGLKEWKETGNGSRDTVDTGQPSVG